MAIPAGLEPATPCLEGGVAINKIKVRSDYPHSVRVTSHQGLRIRVRTARRLASGARGSGVRISPLRPTITALLRSDENARGRIDSELGRTSFAVDPGTGGIVPVHKPASPMCRAQCQICRESGIMESDNSTTACLFSVSAFAPRAEVDRYLQFSSRKMPEPTPGEFLQSQ